MERTTAELLSTIESQKQQLQKYETKLRDVVRAYKGIQKEKEALEASVRALSVSESGQNPDRRLKHSNETSEEEVDIVGPLGTERSGGHEEHLQKQIQTLSASLATLTQEKSRLEASFVADKKKMMSERDTEQKQMQQEIERLSANEEDLQHQVGDLKRRLRSQQLEHTAEQTNHGIMLKELQLLLAEERSNKEQLEVQLENLRTTPKETGMMNEKQYEYYERQVSELSDELSRIRKELKEAHNRYNTPSPMLLDLQNEMEEMKKVYQQQIAEETRRANDAEYRLRTCGKQSEERICSLESKLSEVSSIIGNYDKLRTKDQEVITRLKEKVSQLDNENSALASATSPTLVLESTADATAISEKILYLNDLLMEANKHLEKPVDVIKLLTKSCEKSDIHHPHCAQYKEDLEHLKEEFERYKLRAQSVLKTKAKDTTNKELEMLKDQVSQLKEKLKQASNDHQWELDSQNSRIEHLNKTLQIEQERNRQAMQTVKTQHDKQVKELEHELKKQRERTVALLAEKDGELSLLKRCSVPNYDLEHHYDRHESVDTDSERESKGDDASNVSQLLAESQDHHDEHVLLYVAEEQARKRVEISTLRKQKRQLEYALRDLQHSSTLKQEKLAEEIEGLKEEIWKQKRNITRESANLEYLKNVVFNFLISSDRPGKKKMLKAIMAILQFSSREEERVRAEAYI